MDDPEVANNVATIQHNLAQIGATSEQIGTLLHDGGGSVLLGLVVCLVVLAALVAIGWGAVRLVQKVVS